MRARTVARLSVTPVKSMALHHPGRIHLERWGAVGNRLFYIVDEAGRLLSGSRHGPLARIVARYDASADLLRLDLPDGRAVEGQARTDGVPTITSFWGRPVAGRPVAGPFSKELSHYVGRPVRLMRCERPGDGNDTYPASVVSAASLDELARHLGVARVDGRRFRMLVEVDGCEPHEEDRWMGRRVRVGGAVLRVVEPDPRCVVTTQDPDTGRRDLDTLGAIAAYRGKRDGRHLDFGVYAVVERPGIVRVGDSVEPLEP